MTGAVSSEWLTALYRHITQKPHPHSLNGKMNHFLGRSRANSVVKQKKLMTAVIVVTAPQFQFEYSCWHF
jgi:hypothetical protein